MSARRTAKRLLNRLGLDIRLTRNIAVAETRRKEEEWRQKWHGVARQLAARTIIDVGANTGQFARMIHGVYPDAKIICFEPLPDCYRQLVDALKSIPRSEAHCLALGSESGIHAMHRVGFTPCSSMLNPGDRLRREVPHLGGVTDEVIRMARLDDVIAESDVEPPLLMKLDVQGYETFVLEGARRIVRLADAVVLEVAFLPLYEGQALFGAMHELMIGMGFVYQGSLDQTVSPLDGRITEADALFVRPAGCVDRIG